MEVEYQWFDYYGYNKIKQSKRRFRFSNFTKWWFNENGGTSNPIEITKEGFVTATNLVEKEVIVTSANLSLFWIL